MAWSVRMTFIVESTTNQSAFADDLERLFDSLAESTEEAFPAVSGTDDAEQHAIIIDIETGADDEVTALRYGLNLALRAFQSTGIPFSHLEHAELVRDHADQPISA